MKIFRTGSLAVVLLTAVVSSALAQPAADADQQKQIDTLVTQLSDANWVTRESARESLVKIGKPAIPALKKLSTTANSADLALMIDEAISEIISSGRLEPTMVSLDMPNAEPQAAFTELAKQLGVPIRFEDNLFVHRDAKSFKADNEPFWTAFHKACLLWNVRPETAGWNNGIYLVDEDIRKWCKRPFQVVGPFLVTLDQMDTTSRIEAGDMGNVQGILMISFSILPEPKLDMPWQTTRVSTTAIKDDVGGTWGAVYSAFPTGSTTGRRTAWSARTRLNRPINLSPKRVVDWKGSSVVDVVSGYDDLAIDDIATQLRNPFNYNGGTYFVEEFARNEKDKTWKVTMRFRKGDLSPRAWQVFIRPQNRVKLVDADGVEWRYTDFNESPEQFDNGGSARITLNFVPAKPVANAPTPEPRGPVKLLWQIPAETVSMPIEFGFQDFPVP